MVEIPEALNLADVFLDHQVAAGRGDRIALVTDQKKYSYATVAAWANRFGHALGRAGVEMEQRVALFLGDVPEFVFVWFATVKIGAVVAAVNPEVKPEEAEYYLNYTRARAAVVQASALPTIRGVRGRCPHLKTLFVVGGPDVALEPGEVLFAKACAEAPNHLDPAPTQRDDAAVWLFTSGSTGFPKAAVHRHRDFLYSAECYGLPILEMKETDVTASVPKLFFGYALGNNLLFPFRVGATVVLFPEKSTAERVLEVVTKHKVSALCSVPTSVNAVVNLETPPGRYDWSSLRVATSAGEALPPELYRRWKEKLGVELLDGIGSAEMFHVFVSNRIGTAVPGSLGQAVPGYEVKLMDDDGREVAEGEIGTMWVKGGSISMGYWNRREQSLATFRGEWCVTADKFVRDAAGNYWYRGRADDLLKVGGRFVAPLEIENCLLGHPAVLECAVVGFEDDQKLVKPRAVVVPRPGHVPSEALAAELQAFVKERLQPYKYPREIRFAQELPKSDRGKVLKQKLQA
ncbi:MAG TPA: benzoate-CoA ligase family protein [Myxococcales bacterium]|nr:benzoate-CoA ligase family protein [Myxococcales bacterium]